MNRRQLLKLLISGGVGSIVDAQIDIDRLLWVPNTKKIFLPTPGLSISQIVALELERITPRIRMLFERNDMFYQTIKRNTPVVSSREIRVPLVLGCDWGKDESYSCGMDGNVAFDSGNRIGSTTDASLKSHKSGKNNSGNY